MADWITGNLPGGTGLRLAPQIVDAAKLYLSVVAAHPGSNITFVGHSLGGGLASLMSVYFDRPAVVLDPAPFKLSADSQIVVNALKAELLRQGYTWPAAFSDYTSGYISSPTANPGTFDWQLGYESPTKAVREDNIRSLVVQGEVLSRVLTVEFGAWLGNNSQLPNGMGYLGHASAGRLLALEAMADLNWPIFRQAIDLHSRER